MHNSNVFSADKQDIACLIYYQYIMHSDFDLYLKSSDGYIRLDLYLGIANYPDIKKDVSNINTWVKCIGKGKCFTDYILYNT